MRTQTFWPQLLLISIFLFGIFLRSVELINGNYLFGHDQGRDMLIARSIVDDKKLRLIGNEVGSGVAGINGIFHGPGYLYVLALGHWLFRGDPYGGMVMMMAFGVLSLIIGYYASKRMYGFAAAVLILLFISISYLIISQSRFIWSSHIATPLILVALYFMYRIPENPGKFLPLAMFASAFTYESQLGVAVPMILGLSLSAIFIYRSVTPKILVLSCIGLIVGFLPMIVFDARHGFLGMRGVLGYLMTGSGGQGIPLERIADHFRFYYFNFINTFTYEFGFFNAMVQKISVFLFVPFVLFHTVKDNNSQTAKFHYTLYAIIIITWVAYLLLNNTIWDYYLMHLRIIYIFLFGYAGSRILVRPGSSLLKKLGLASFLVFLFVFLSGAFYRLYISYTADLYDQGGSAKIYGKKFAIDTVYGDASGQKFNIFVFTPYVYTFPYDYLLQTYAYQKYGFVPGSEKKGLAYLIIEPDLDKPWRHNGWLETVVNGGKVIFHKELPTGQILEKRVY